MLKKLLGVLFGSMFAAPGSVFVENARRERIIKEHFNSLVGKGLFRGKQERSFYSNHQAVYLNPFTRCVVVFRYPVCNDSPYLQLTLSKSGDVTYVGNQEDTPVEEVLEFLDKVLKVVLELEVAKHAQLKHKESFLRSCFEELYGGEFPLEEALFKMTSWAYGDDVSVPFIGKKFIAKDEETEQELFAWIEALPDTQQAEIKLWVGRRADALIGVPS